MRARVGSLVSRWLRGSPDRPAVTDRARRLQRAVACAIEPLEERQMMSMTMDLQMGSNLNNFSTMRVAMNQVADYVERLFDDNITLKVDVERAAMGATPYTVTTQNFTFDYDTIRDLMASDASSADALATLLPTASQVSYDTASGVTAGTGITATRANLLALGVAPAVLDSAASAYKPAVLDIDFSLVFSSNVTWDYNRSDGTAAGSYDFFSVATQAIFKGLGFTSTVDTANGQSSGTINPTTLDLFRVAPGAVASSDFTSATRILSAGTASVFFDGGTFDPSAVGLTGYAAGEIAMSTGTGSGGGRDGYLAAGWKDNAVTGKYLGIMDSTPATGAMHNLLATDLRALSFIGWDLTATTPMLEAHGALVLNGTDGADVLEVQYTSPYNVYTNGLMTQFTVGGIQSITVSGGAGNDEITLYGGVKGALLNGGDGNDSITGGNNDDTIYGGNGDDFIRGKNGKDFISGGAGIDTVSYDEKTSGVNVTLDGVANDGTSNEQDNVQDDIEVLIGTKYADNLNASAKSSGGITIFAGAGNDVIVGSPFSDTLYGEDGADTLHANDGEYDVVDGGAGIDIAYIDLLVDSWNLLDTLL